MKKVGIIGSGDVGRSLASGFLKYDYHVIIGTRNPDKLKKWLTESGDKICAGSFDDAAAYSDLLVLAVKGTAVNIVLATIDPEHLKGKTVIDTTNPIGGGPEKGVLRFFTRPNDSLFEQTQSLYPDVHFVKAFNSIGSANMVNPDFHGEKPTMFICGSDANAKSQVAKIVELFGFEVADMGDAIAARAIEPLSMLWCIPGFLHNDWNHAFRLINR